MTVHTQEQYWSVLHYITALHRSILSNVCCRHSSCEYTGAVLSSTVISSISSSIYSHSICSSSGDVLCLQLLHADSTAADQISWTIFSLRLRFAAEKRAHVVTVRNPKTI